jgi:hypothetical protein
VQAGSGDDRTKSASRVMIVARSERRVMIAAVTGEMDVCIVTPLREPPFELAKDVAGDYDLTLREVEEIAERPER